MNKYALISVFDKSNIEVFSSYLVRQHYNILSTDNTGQYLDKYNIPNIRISAFTKFPEMLNGRVKTLHPKIYGGILGLRDREKERDIATYIDMVIVNLYPFKQVINRKNHTLEDAINNIDIGGVSLLRAAAKNYKHVLSITEPEQYNKIMGLQKITDEIKLEFAKKTWKYVTDYDITISSYLNKDTTYRTYEKQYPLKYGCNSYQTQGGVYKLKDSYFPFKILNGSMSYINQLDAIISWKLVTELKDAFSIPCAASFKHNTPAGVGTGIDLSNELLKVCFINSEYKLNSTSNAFLRARYTDPLSSFGDFIAISDRVEEETALLIKNEVSDGIIAPSFSDKALEILRSKKSGNYIIIEGNPYYHDNIAYRELYNVVLSQKENIQSANVLRIKNIVTEKKNINNYNNLLLANITCKYTPSNSIVMAYDGQVIGVGAGQQNRVDCIRLAGEKGRMWFLRQHEQCLNIKFGKKAKRTDKINSITRYLQEPSLITNFDHELCSNVYPTGKIPKQLNNKDKEQYLKQIMKNIALASDGFFPFADSIEECNKYGVSHIVQPGGSVSDESVIWACDAHNMIMYNSGVRFFTH
uniref:MGS-like domain-containing protein n=1 Tax=viral metagenome TaxID=1070528 RepID=A0A6C0KH01_9ZZZZ